MGSWRLLYIFIHIELVVHLLAYKRSLDRYFEHNITTVTIIKVNSYFLLIIIKKQEGSHVMSRASHAVEVDSNPNLSMTSPIRVG